MNEAAPQKASLGRRISSHFRKRLLEGMFLLIPFVVTVWVLKFTYDLLTAPMQRYLPGRWGPAVRGIVALGITVGLVYLLGLAVRTFVGRKIMKLINWLAGRVPVVKGIYGATKQLLDSARMGREGGFKEVVLVDYPHQQAKAVGFVTASFTDPTSGEHYINVFVPTAPNPTAGFCLLVKKSLTRPTPLTVDQAIRLIISGGILTPGNILARSEAHPTAPVQQQSPEQR